MQDTVNETHKHLSNFSQSKLFAFKKQANFSHVCQGRNIANIIALVLLITAVNFTVSEFHFQNTLHEA